MRSRFATIRLAQSEKVCSHLSGTGRPGVAFLVVAGRAMNHERQVERQPFNHTPETDSDKGGSFQGAEVEGSCGE